MLVSPLPEFLIVRIGWIDFGIPPIQHEFRWEHCKHQKVSYLIPISFISDTRLIGHEVFVRSVKDSCSSHFQVVSDLPASSQRYLVSNENLDDYRVALAPGKVTKNGDFIIDQATFQALQLAVGGLVRFITMNKSSAQKTDSQAA